MVCNDIGMVILARVVQIGNIESTLLAKIYALMKGVKIVFELRISIAY